MTKLTRKYSQTFYLLTIYSLPFIIVLFNLNFFFFFTKKLIRLVIIMDGVAYEIQEERRAGPCRLYGAVLIKRRRRERLSGN